MDTRHRVYYLVNLNQNHGKNWENIGYDDYGFIYRDNLKGLQTKIHSLKIRPHGETYPISGYFQLKISCRKEEEEVLLRLLKKLPRVSYMRCF